MLIFNVYVVDQSIVLLMQMMVNLLVINHKRIKNFFCFFLDQSSGNALLFPFLEAAQNQIIPPPPSPRELFPALAPLSLSGLPGDTSFTD